MSPESEGARPSPRQAPRWARQLLEACLDAQAAEAALGDLAEDVLGTGEADRLSLRTRWRYWREALSICSRTLADRCRRRVSAVLPERGNGRRGGRARVWTGVLEDARFALRLLWRRPATVFSAAASLALGIALNAVMLAVLHAAWVQSVPYPHADRLVDVHGFRQERPDRRVSVSSADFVAWRDATTDVFESFGAYVSFGSFDLTGDAGPVRLDRDLATAGVFQALGTPPLLGRTFVAGDEVAGSDRVVLLSYPFWQSKLGGDRGVVGRSILLDGVPYGVVGVMPRGFGVRGGTPDLWAPLSFGEHRPIDRRTSYLVGVARLRQGVTLAQARSRLETVSREIAQAHPQENRDLLATAEPLREVMTGAVRPLFTLLLGSVLLVLLMVSLNVANLLSVLRLGRRQEIAVRRVLGASALRLRRQTLIEGLCIALLGGSAGTLASVAGARLLPDLRDSFLHRYVVVEVNAWVVALSLLLSLACAVIIGLLPGLAVPLRRIEGFAIESGSRVSRRRVALSVVVLQTALCMLLLVAAGVTLRSVLRLQALDVGYRHRDVLSAELNLPRSRYENGERALAFQHDLLERLDAMPRVTAAALSNELPGGGWSFGPSVRGRSEEPGVSARWLAVSRGYFDTIGLSLRQGRTFSTWAGATGEAGSPGPRVAVINQTAARQLFGERSPLGEGISLDGPEHWYEVIGVVDDVLGDPTKPPEPAAYFLLDQVLRDVSIEEGGLRQSSLLVRGAGPREPFDGLENDVVAALHAVDPLLPLAHVAALEERLAQKLVRPRLSTGVLSLFGVIALALSALGLYGLMALGVRLQKRELAVRLALGAQPEKLIGRLVVRGLALTGAGAGLGLMLAWLLRSRVQGLVVGIAPFDRAVVLAALLLLVSVSLVACWIPARRVLGVDPARTLQAD